MWQLLETSFKLIKRGALGEELCSDLEHDVDNRTMFALIAR